MRESCEPIGDIEQDRLDALIDRIGDARVVLLGEATHGTSEFYRMRARITRELVQRRGFTLVAVEADWPDAARVDHYVRHLTSPRPPWTAFTRFPTWMWRNREVEQFVQWLHEYNRATEAPERRVGFCGLDLYSLYTSIGAVLAYLDDVDPEAARVARVRYGCLTPWEGDPAAYGRAVLSQGYRDCEEAVVAMLRDMLDKRLDYQRRDGERYLDALQNARVVANAERYYRAMYYGSRESWNLRDQHMFETLQVLLAFRGPDTKAVIWEHNSHIGNAAATEMGARGELNVGQLARETLWRGRLRGRLRNRPRHGGRGERLGRSDGGEAGTPGAPGKLRAALPRRGHRCIPAPAPPPAPSGRARRAGWPHGSSAPSASSTGPKPSWRATTSRPCCRRSSMSTCGSTSRTPSPRSLQPPWYAACPKPIRSACRPDRCRPAEAVGGWRAAVR